MPTGRSLTNSRRPQPDSTSSAREGVAHHTLTTPVTANTTSAAVAVCESSVTHRTASTPPARSRGGRRKTTSAPIGTLPTRRQTLVAPGPSRWTVLTAASTGSLNWSFSSEGAVVS